MVYQMEIYVDGGCRRNGYSNAIGAAAAVLEAPRGTKYSYRAEQLNSYENVTNQRAEITAIILGQKMTRDKYEDLNGYPTLNLTIHSDSRYVVDCLTDFVYKWANNGWTNARGDEVANRDLIEKASDLDDELRKLGTVKYRWIPRADNERADGHCNKVLDDMDDDSDSSSS